MDPPASMDSSTAKCATFCELDCRCVQLKGWRSRYSNQCAHLVRVHVHRGRQALDAELGIVHKLDDLIAVGEHIHICVLRGNRSMGEAAGFLVYVYQKQLQVVL